LTLTYLLAPTRPEDLPMRRSAPIVTARDLRAAADLAEAVSAERAERAAEALREARVKARLAARLAGIVLHQHGALTCTASAEVTRTGALSYRIEFRGAHAHNIWVTDIQHPADVARIAAHWAGYTDATAFAL
jgi:hypothetical protein